MRLLLTFATALLLTATHGQTLLGQEHWPDGTLKATRYSEGERIHFITFHENGQVKEVGGFLQGRRDGVWKQYSDTGVLLARAGFHKGERQGTWEFRHAEDTPMGRLTYASGRLQNGEQYGSTGELSAHRAY
jgi:antitoxin component YwqK of YwqJK toxin-antitoxin module